MTYDPIKEPIERPVTVRTLAYGMLTYSTDPALGDICEDCGTTHLATFSDGLQCWTGCPKHTRAIGEYNTLFDEEREYDRDKTNTVVFCERARPGTAKDLRDVLKDSDCFGSESHKVEDSRK